MSLRKLPCLTPALPAARRANALKSTCPRTERGKARVAPNPLKHGRRAVPLGNGLARAGYRESEALYCRIRSRISQALSVPGIGVDLAVERQADRLANWVWVSRRRLHGWHAKRAKLECALETT